MLFCVLMLAVEELGVKRGINFTNLTIQVSLTFKMILTVHSYHTECRPLFYNGFLGKNQSLCLIR